MSDECNSSCKYVFTGADDCFGEEVRIAEVERTEIAEL